jgi:hypothetical protein
VLYLRAGISHLHCAAHQWRSERADAESRPRIQVMADREIGLLDSLTAERYYKVCRRGGRAREPRHAARGRDPHLPGLAVVNKGSVQ